MSDRMMKSPWAKKVKDPLSSIAQEAARAVDLGGTGQRRQSVGMLPADALAAVQKTNLPRGRSKAQDMQRVGWIVDPRQTKWMPRWDMLMVAALTFTALVTPVEVVFLQEGTYITDLWIVNRFVDLLFLIDIVVTFNLAFQESAENGGHWVINKHVIICQYLKGWVSHSAPPSPCKQRSLTHA